ncbi:hypothetical protein DAPPUDRAFT_304902 [Daphnia pulex]|uniref:Uncharacterized protein n=1 Tax=Daphnia pulex TaxID=6669 RepID=E9GMN1_DAPPU|nr:hypothetical protein DAPPUDRAFT_304902 [Daphnia pulex]|eukprot:EFX79265.1 hypothetical protein DAPPUDRAFT_304902 [Daphnia pulex]
MQIRNWLSYHPLLVFVTLMGAVTIASTLQRQLPNDPWNLRPNQLVLINPDDYSPLQPVQDQVETMVDTYKVPKRTLSLFTRWKTLEQLRRNHLHHSLPLSSPDFDPLMPRQQKKIPMPSNGPKEEMVSLPGMSSEMSLSARAIQRSLRPPGQPLRWG